jgi:CRISPR system Cascade subunit CasE
MNFLTRVTVDHRSAAKWHLRDSYAWHQALWRTFPEKEKRDFLFRVEPQEAGFLVYLLSESNPGSADWGQWETKSVAGSFLEHPAYRFQLCANPTVKKKRDGRKNGTRTAMYEPDELSAWLARKAEQGGFAVDATALQISPPLNQPFYKKGQRGNHKRVEYQGVLKVTHPEKFKETFNRGIGSAKAFGFGLLVLQPIH